MDTKQEAETGGASTVSYKASPPSSSLGRAAMSRNMMSSLAAPADISSNYKTMNGF